MRKLLLVLMVVGGLLGAPLAAKNQFLDDYPPMTADKQRPQAQIYVAPGKSLAGFDRIAIDPILIWFAPDSEYQGIEPNELAEITNGLREALVDALEPNYAVVRNVGPGVLRLRLAITDISAEKRKRGLLGYTPTSLAVGAAKSAVRDGPNIILESAKIEAELLDAKGVRLAVIIEPLFSKAPKLDDRLSSVTDPLLGNDPIPAPGKLTWRQIGEVLTDYGTRLRTRLDADNSPAAN